MNISKLNILLNTIDSSSDVQSIGFSLNNRTQRVYKSQYGDTRTMSEKIKSLLD